MAGGLSSARSVEILILEPNLVTVWKRMPDLVQNRCCWPQMGTIGRNLYILGGGGSAESVEVWDGSTSAGLWRLEPKLGLTPTAEKRERFRTIFAGLEAGGVNSTNTKWTQCSS